MAGGPTRYIEGPSGERVITAAGSVAITGARTYVILCRVRSDASGSRSVFTVSTGATNTDRREGIWFDASANKLYLAMPPSTGLSSTFAALTSPHSKWLMFAVSIPAGTGQTPRATVKNFTDGTLVAHANGATNVDGWAGTPTTITFGDAPGGWELPVDVAAFAAFSANLNDTQRASLATGIQAWLDLSPVALQETGWRAASPATPITDEIGGADQTSVSGTSVNADDGPPGFDWTRGGDPDPSEITLDGTVPAVTGAFSGLVGRTVTLAGTVPAVTGAFAVTSRPEVTLAGTVPAVTGAFLLEAGEVDANELVLAGTVAAPAGAFAVTVGRALALAGTVAAPTGAFGLVAGNATLTLAGVIPPVTGQFIIRREAIVMRTRIAEQLSTMPGVTGYARRPKTPRPGDAWPLLSSLSDQQGLAYLWTWRIIVLLPQDEGLANDWLDERAEELIDALTAANGEVTRVEPVRLILEGGTSGESYAIQATLITGLE